MIFAVIVCSAAVVAGVVVESGQLSSKLQAHRFRPALKVAAPDGDGNQKVLPTPFFLLKLTSTPDAAVLANLPSKRM